MQPKSDSIKLHKFELKLKEAKANLKFAKDFIFVIEMWNKRSDYNFSSIGDREIVGLFGANNKTFYSCGSLSFNISRLNSYIYSYSIKFGSDAKISKPEIVKLRSAIFSISKLEKEDNSKFWEISNELEHLIK